MNTSMSSALLRLQAQTFHFFSTFRLTYTSPSRLAKCGKMGLWTKRRSQKNKAKRRSLFGRVLSLFLKQRAHGVYARALAGLAALSRKVD